MGSRKWILLADHEIVNVSSDGWTEYKLMENGRTTKKACKPFPKTCRLLRGIPEVTGDAGQANFFRLTPGTRLVPLHGTTNKRLVAHLALMVPDGPRIRVENQTRQWKEGEVLVFGDAFR